MNESIEKLHLLRQYAGQLVEGLTPEQLNRIPAGCSNNIIWHLGHLVAAQDALIYLRSGHSEMIKDAVLFEAYKPGTKPQHLVTEQEIAHLKAQLSESLNLLSRKYAEIKGAAYETFTTRYGVTIGSVDDALAFLPFHEGMHIGYIMAFKKLVAQ